MKIYIFDDAVNAVLSAKEDKALRDKLAEYSDCFSVKSFVSALYDICVEKRMYASAEYISGFSETDIHISAGLYNSERLEKTKRLISDSLSYCFSGLGTETYMVIYHLMKNKCYELTEKYLDMLELLGVNNRLIANLAGLSVKNKDLRFLRMFLKRGYCIDILDADYLKGLDEDYYTNVVSEELKKYGMEGELGFYFDDLKNTWI